MHMSTELAGAATIGSIALLTSVGFLPDAETIKEVGSLPVVVVLGAVCCWMAWLMTRQSDKFADKFAQTMRDQGAAWKEATKSFNDLANEIKGRPCLHLHRREGDEKPYGHKRSGE